MKEPRPGTRGASSERVMADRLTILELVRSWRWREAVDEYEASLEALRHDQGLAATMAYAYLHAGQYEKAAQSLGIALLLYPDNQELRFTFIRLLLALDRIDEAEEAARQAVSRFPRSGQLSAQLAEILEAHNKLPEAAECFRELAEHYEYPGWVSSEARSEVIHEAMQTQHACNAIRCYLKAGNRSAALALAETWARRIPDSASLDDLRLHRLRWGGILDDLHSSQDPEVVAGKQSFRGVDCQEEAKRWLREMQEEEPLRH
jgi:tetratricopeptide (TPR) repeat protein